MARFYGNLKLLELEDVTQPDGYFVELASGAQTGKLSARELHEQALSFGLVDNSFKYTLG